MAQIKVLDLNNACSLSELSCEDANVVSGGFVAVLAASKSLLAARAAYTITLVKTGSTWLARAASLSTP